MAIGQIIQAGVSALPLFIGENSLFSGKKRQATIELGKTFEASKAYELPSEYKEAYQSAMQQRGMGLPSAALGLYSQQAMRQQQSQLGALGGRRSLLAGLGTVVQGGQDSALRLAGMESDAKMRNIRYADQMAIQYGGLKQREDIRKLDERAQYWGTKRQESDRAISGALQGLGAAAGSLAQSEMYKDIYGSGSKKSLFKPTRNMRQLGITPEDVMGI